MRAGADIRIQVEQSRRLSCRSLLVGWVQTRLLHSIRRCRGRGLQMKSRPWSCSCWVMRVGLLRAPSTLSTAAWCASADAQGHVNGGSCIACADDMMALVGRLGEVKSAANIDETVQAQKSSVGCWECMVAPIGTVIPITTPFSQCHLRLVIHSAVKRGIRSRASCCHYSRRDSRESYNLSLGSAAAAQRSREAQKPNQSARPHGGPAAHIPHDGPAHWVFCPPQSPTTDRE